MASGGFAGKPIAGAAFAGDSLLTSQQFVQETVSVSDAAAATRPTTTGFAAELLVVADGINATILSAGQKFIQESVLVSDSQTIQTIAVALNAETASILDKNVALNNVYMVLASETASVLDSYSAFKRILLDSVAETVIVIDVPLGTVIPLSVGSPFDYSGIAVFTDADAPVAGSLAIGGGQTTTATISETISVADSNLGFVNVIPPPPVVVARDHDGVSHQPYPKRHKYKAPDLIAAELHRRNKLRSQIEDVMQDASYLPNLLGRSNKIVQLPAKAAKAVVPKLDQLPSSPERISDLSRLIVSLRHRAPNDDEEAMNLILQNLWKP
jgi:hypothetical protein